MKPQRLILQSSKFQKLLLHSVTSATILSMAFSQALAQKAPNIVEMSAIPVIVESIVALSPTFSGKRSPAIMNQVCLLANGELSLEAFQKFFVDQNIDLETQVKEDKNYALLIEQDMAQMKIACAAYLASNVLTDVDLSEFMEKVPKAEIEKAAEKAQKETLESQSNAQNNANPTGQSKEENAPKLKINQDKLVSALSLKLAVAQTNSAFFATIATQLEKVSSDSLTGYRRKIQALFSTLAPFYLANIKTHIDNKTTVFNLLQLQNGRFSFSTSTGYLFDYSQQGLSFKINNINWYGNGEILGKRYMLNVAYLPDSANALIQSSLRNFEPPTDKTKSPDDSSDTKASTP